MALAALGTTLTANRLIAWLLARVETLALVHAGAALLFASWVFGGNISWARTMLAGWNTLALPLTALALARPEVRARAWVLLPWALLGALVMISCLNPSLTPIQFDDGPPSLINSGEKYAWLPSAARPSVALQAWFFSGGAWLMGCNLWLVVRRRSSLRLLLAITAVNTFVLAVFGTLQKLLVPSVKVSGGYFSGLYFGAATSPQERFFSTFIYNNHWGAFLTLFLAVTAGLLFHQAARSRPLGRDLWHTPFTVLLIAALLMAASAPMSASRAATLMAVLLLLLGSGAALFHVAAARRSRGVAVAPAIALLLALLLAFLAASAWLAREPITARLRDTQEALKTNGTLLGGRFALWRDTWQLAMEKPVFGWGLDSYSTVFMFVRPRPLEAKRQYEKSYGNAHSDWLQAVAETGLVGTTLLVLMGALPLSTLLTLPRHARRHPLVVWPLLGCALIALYAWVEFPFGNGAVMIAFWLVFFSALRLARLQAKVEEADA